MVSLAKERFHWKMDFGKLACFPLAAKRPLKRPLGLKSWFKVRGLVWIQQHGSIAGGGDTFPRMVWAPYRFCHLPSPAHWLSPTQLTPTQATKSDQQLPLLKVLSQGKKKGKKKALNVLQDAKNGLVSQSKRNIFQHHNEIFINSRH